MKFALHFLSILVSFFFISSTLSAQTCQDIPELSFANPQYHSSDSYRFSSVLPGIDAIVSITNAVNASLYDIDLTNTGQGTAFQPQVQLNNQNFNGAEGYMDFQIDFVVSNTNTLTSISEWSITAVDVDGDDYRLRESVGFTNFSSYTLESNSMLDLSDTSTPSMTVFEASSIANLEGITTDNSQHMVYMKFEGNSSFQIRTRIIDNGSQVDESAASARMFSFFFDPCIIQDFLVPNTLPVEFSYFQVEAKEKGALLSWETLVELNNDRFEIEKSIDGVAFTKIGQTEGAGNSYHTQQYNFFDPVPAEGKNYYRLKQIDFDGQFVYSELKEVQFNYEQANFFYTVYPNPASEYIKVASPSSTEDMEVRLLNSTGKLVMTGQLHGGETELNVQELPAGVYYLNVLSEKFQTKGKAIVLK